MNIGFNTDKGLVRQNNEDALLIIPDKKIFAVADGVGGNNSGEIASSMTVELLKEYFDEKINKETLINGIKEVNLKVISKSIEKKELCGMATTLILMQIEEDTLNLLNVGDSRCYIYSNKKKKLEQLSEDHTYINKLLKEGIITKEESINHENSHMITKAIGTDIELEPDFEAFKVSIGDIIILCTDGLYGEIDDDSLEKYIEESKTMTGLCKNLISEAKERGGRDNITVICIEITEDDIDE